MKYNGNKKYVENWEQMNGPLREGVEYFKNGGEIMNVGSIKDPIAKNGGELQKIDQMTNFALYDKSIKGSWLNKYK
jgi:hypothetical protein